MGLLLSSAGVFLLGAFAAIGVIVAAWPLLVMRLHRRRMVLVLALVAVLVVCSIVGQYLFDQGGIWMQVNCTHHSAACH